jgi:hypothetical protein
MPPSVPFTPHHYSLSGDALCCACSEALLGTDSGAIYELSLDEGKKEKLRLLHELAGEAGPIAGMAQVWLAWRKFTFCRLCVCKEACGTDWREAGGGGWAARLWQHCHCGAAPAPQLKAAVPQAPVKCAHSNCLCHLTSPQLALSAQRRLALALCGTRLHAFSGGPTLDVLFAAYSPDVAGGGGGGGGGGSPGRHIDLPTQGGAAQLQLLYPAKQPEGGGGLSTAMDAPFSMARPEAFAVRAAEAGCGCGDACVTRLPPPVA